MPKKELYLLASEFRKTKLWEFLSESEMFAVQMADGEIGYVSVMGSLGEHLALAVYPGTAGLESYRTLWKGTDGLREAESYETMMGQDCIMCSFGGKEDLRPLDQKEIRAHGLTFRGKHAYPVFDRFRPMHFPWYLEDERDEEHLRVGLLAGLEVARRLDSIPAQQDMFRMPDPGASKEALGFEEGEPIGREIPLLTPRADSTFDWGRLSLPEPAAPVFEEPRLENDIARAKLRKKRRQGAWECGVIMMPQPVTNEETDDGTVMEPTRAPMFPLALLIVDHTNGIALHQDMVMPAGRYMSDLLNIFVEGMLRCGVPAQVFVRDARTQALLTNISKELKIELCVEKHLPYLDELEDGLVKMARAEGRGDAESMFESMIEATPRSELPEVMVRQFQDLLESSAVTGEVAEKLRRYLAGESDVGGEKALMKGKLIEIPAVSIKKQHGSSEAASPVRAKKKGALHRSFVISVSLKKGCYRHIRISADETLGTLHDAILDAFDLLDGFAHAFFMDNRLWSPVGSYYAEGISDRDRFTSGFRLADVGLIPGKSFKYMLDFGEEWTFQCKVLRILEDATENPQVIRSIGRAPLQYGYGEDDGDYGEDDGAEFDEGDDIFSLPEVFPPWELNKRYLNLLLSEEKIQLLRSYFFAFASLYGVLPLRKALEIYNSQNRPIAETLFADFTEIARHESRRYAILGPSDLYSDVKGPDAPMDRMIVSGFLADDLDDYHEMIKAQAGKPYYVPPKDQLLQYQDDCYFERNAAFIALRDYLKEQGLTTKKADDAAESLHLLASMTRLDMQEAIDEVQRAGVTFKGIEGARTFFDLYTELSNNTRLQSNRGHTPNELFMRNGLPEEIRLGPGITEAIRRGDMSIEEMRRNVAKMDFPNEGMRASFIKELDRIGQVVKGGGGTPQAPLKKVGRNDPCPCGSGKKYKHCCGKTV